MKLRRALTGAIDSSHSILSGRAKERDEKLDELIDVFSRFAHFGGR